MNLQQTDFPLHVLGMVISIRNHSTIIILHRIAHTGTLKLRLDFVLNSYLEVALG